MVYPKEAPHGRKVTPRRDGPGTDRSTIPHEAGAHAQDFAGNVDAVTENISANGILFTGFRLPKVDSQIEFTIRMPAGVMGTSEDVSIDCIGRVVRHQLHGEQAQAAAIIDEYTLRA